MIVGQFNKRGNLVSTVLDIVSKDLEPEQKKAFSKLRQACTKLINGVKEIQDYEKHVEHITKTKSISEGLSGLYSYVRQTTGAINELLRLQQSFQLALNTFLGRTIYLTWVGPNGEIYYFDQVDIKSIYAQATSNKGVRGNISLETMLDYINKHSRKLANTQNRINSAMYPATAVTNIKNRLQKAQKSRIRVYQEAVRRFNKTKEGEMHDPKLNYSVYWRDNPTSRSSITGYINVRNRGDIAEGYVDAVINEDKDVFYIGGKQADKDSKYYDIGLETSLRGLSKLININSIQGAVKGDVVFEENGNIQFAVKQGSYSTARFAQYLRLAYNTLALPEMSKEDYEKFLNQTLEMNITKKRFKEELDNTVVDNFIKWLQQANFEISKEDAKKDFSQEVIADLFG